MAAESVVVENLRAVFSRIDASKTIWIAYSGGLDSTVLLHAANQTAGSSGHHLRAIHIDHQLHQDSLQWSQECIRQCESWGIELDVVRVDAQPFMELGLEGAARKARYLAWQERLGANDVLLTAHHADDQIETVLLQLLRGSGAHGLAGCASQRALGDGLLIRPFLNVRRNEIQRYAVQHTLSWLDDPSNDSLQHDRNFLRHKLMPLMHERWTGLHETIARSAQWQSEHSEILNEVASQDLPEAHVGRDQPLACVKLTGLSEARLRNALRWWIRQQGFPVPSAKIMQRIVNDVVFSADDREPCVSWQNVEIRKYRGELYVNEQLGAHDVTMRVDWNLIQPLELPSLQLTLTPEALQESGIVLRNIKHLQVRFREGGEVMRPRGRGCQKELKTLFQEAGVAPWLRNRVPLLFHEDELIYVWGYWLGEGY